MMKAKVKIMFAVMLGLVFMNTSCGAQCGNKQAEVKEQKEASEKKFVQELSLDGFKKNIMDYDANPKSWNFKGERPAVIDFYAVWCGPCKVTAPIFESLAEEYDGKIDFYKVDVDKQQELAAMFGIRSIPSLLFIPKKGDPDMKVGAMNRADLENAIKSILLK